MDSNRSSSGPQGTTSSAEEITARFRNATSARAPQRGEIEIWCVIRKAPSLGLEGDPTKSLEVSSQSSNISGISLQTRQNTRQKIKSMQNLLSLVISIKLPGCETRWLIFWILIAGKFVVKTNSSASVAIGGRIMGESDK